MKTRIIVLISVLAAIILTACNTQAAPVFVSEGADRDAITAKTDLIINDLLAGIENKDYDTFTKHFSEVMLKSITPSEMEKFYATFDPLGKSTSAELVNVQDVGDYFAARYKVTYESKNVVFKIVVDKADPAIVDGLWFE